MAPNLAWVSQQRSHRHWGAVMAVLCALVNVGGASAASAEGPLTSDYQVKLLVSDEANAAPGEFTEEFAERYGVSAPRGSESAVYLDTADHFYLDRGWSIRVRYREGKDHLDVTYKKRYPLRDVDLEETDIAAAEDRARADKLLGNEDFSAQVNVSYQSATLDLSAKKKVPCPQSGCAVPEGEDAALLAAQLEPQAMRSDVGTPLADQGVIASSPVRQRTYRANIAGIKTDIESSRIGGRDWVEVSEKETNRGDALQKRKKLLKELSSQGYLEPADAFKTPLIVGELKESV